MNAKRPEPTGDPINVYFREALLIGGEATRLYLVRHAQSQGNTGEDLATGDPDLTDVGWEQARRLWTHRLKLERPQDLDDKLAGWLKDSWATYSRPPDER